MTRKELIKKLKYVAAPFMLSGVLVLSSGCKNNFKDDLLEYNKLKNNSLEELTEEEIDKEKSDHDLAVLENKKLNNLTINVSEENKSIYKEVVKELENAYTNQDFNLCNKYLYYTSKIILKYNVSKALNVKYDEISNFNVVSDEQKEEKNIYVNFKYNKSNVYLELKEDTIKYNAIEVEKSYNHSYTDKDEINKIVNTTLRESLDLELEYQKDIEDVYIRDNKKVKILGDIR